jgi:hypothetical protein
MKKVLLALFIFGISAAANAQVKEKIKIKSEYGKEKRVIKNDVARDDEKSSRNTGIDKSSAETSSNSNSIADKTYDANNTNEYHNESTHHAYRAHSSRAKHHRNHVKSSRKRHSTAFNSTSHHSAYGIRHRAKRPIHYKKKKEVVKHGKHKVKYKV